MLLSPPEITAATVEAGVRKARLSTCSTLILAFLAGAYIAFASEGSTMAAFNLLARPETYGLGRALAGALFGTGLMLVVVAGGELFTGNTLMVGAWAAKRISVAELLRNWLLVYCGNFVGSLFLAWLMAKSGLFASGNGLFGVITLKMAAAKTSLPFGSAVALGLLCNWLVCLAVWMATGAKDMTGKLLAIFFPIWLFITSGFEHSVANMYYIPAGLFAKAQPALVEAALASGMPMAKLEQLSWATFLTRNLLPVTLGNLLGGALFVMGAYALAYFKPTSEPTHP